MDKTTRTNRDNLRSEDRELQNKAFFYVLKTTDKPVDWAYEVWDRCELHAGDRKRVEQPGPYVSICRPVDPLAGKPEGDIRSEDARPSRLARWRSAQDAAATKFVEVRPALKGRTQL